MRPDATKSSTDTIDPAGPHNGATTYLVVALDCAEPLAYPMRLSMASVDEVLIRRGKTRSYERDGLQLSIFLADSSLSSQHVRLQRANDRWVAIDLNSKNGTRLNGQPLASAPLSDGDILVAGNSVLVFRELGELAAEVQGMGGLDLARVDASDDEMLTTNIALQAQLTRLPQLARSDISVLVAGATGTGKEVVARALHKLSGRAGRFVAINCGALTPTLLESALFGHIKGAFSGAGEAKLGFVRSADGGTLFLDEISEMDPASQVALLRVIQEREVYPVGADEPVSVDVRFVSATNRPVATLCADGYVREDIYPRVAGTVIELPRLVERREDIGLLIGRLLRRLDSDGGAGLTLRKAAAETLFAYPWPNNVRELEQVLRAALAVKRDNVIRPRDLPQALRERAKRATRPPEFDEPALSRRAKLIASLEAHAGNVRAVARDFAKAPTQIYRWCAQLGIDIDAYRKDT